MTKLTQNKKPRKPGSGGKRERSGRKPLEIPKVDKTLSLDEDVVKWYTDLGGKFSAHVNKVLRAHMERINQLATIANNFTDLP